MASDDRRALGRRELLGLTGVGLAWLASGCASTGTEGSAATSVPESAGTTPGTASTVGEALGPADFASLGTCVLLPEMAAGPFPNRERLERADITEGVAGLPLLLGLRVVDDACAPLDDAEVEVWHADASGDYSSYVDRGTGKDEGPGTTFLRGVQPVDGDGIVRFATIWPGWYVGRAVHVHVRVRRDGEVVRTTQLFFPDERNAEVLAAGPYAEFGPPDTSNAADGLGGDIERNGSLLHVRTAASGSGLVALVNLGVPVA